MTATGMPYAFPPRTPYTGRSVRCRNSSSAQPPTPVMPKTMPATKPHVGMHLLPPVKAFAPLPQPASKASQPHWGAATRDVVIRRLQRFVTNAMEHELDRGMHFPTGWDSYFNDYMTLRDVCHYPTQGSRWAA